MGRAVLILLLIVRKDVMELLRFGSKFILVIFTMV